MVPPGARLPAGIGVARGFHLHQIPSIFCHVVLSEVLSQTKYCSSLKVKIFGPPKNFALAMLPPAGLF